MRAEHAPLSRALRTASLASLLVLCGACEWFTDFKRQPFVTTWESLRADSLVVRGSPQGSVPYTGSMAPGLQFSYGPTALDSMAGLRNPVPADEASLARGRLQYQLNCAVCHGSGGAGNGPATTYGMIPMPLTSDRARALTDGYLFAMIRNGRGLMPTYNRIEEMDRWDIVNYVRALQGVVTGVPFDTGAVAMPGVTGDRVPGATRIGPNRGVPHVMPDGAIRGSRAIGDTTRADTARTPGRAGGAP